jgi:hypothetical protein
MRNRSFLISTVGIGKPACPLFQAKDRRNRSKFARQAVLADRRKRTQTIKIW